MFHTICKCALGWSFLAIILSIVLIWLDPFLRKHNLLYLSVPIHGYLNLTKKVYNLIIDFFSWIYKLGIKFFVIPLRKFSSFRRMENYATANWNKYLGKYFKRKTSYADVILNTKYKFKW